MLTNVSGTIIDQIWDNTSEPYVITDTASVPMGHTLTISPGVEVLTDGGAELFISGTVNATGVNFSATDNEIEVRSGGALNLISSTVRGNGTSFVGGLVSFLAGSSGTVTRSVFDLSDISFHSSSSVVATCNNFASARILAVGSPIATIDLVHNYWGTQIVEDIADLILDHSDSATRPLVGFTPILAHSCDFAGDYNHDHVVDAVDYTVWRNTVGSTDDFRTDGSGSTVGVPDGVVDAHDYAFWKANYGNTLPPPGGGGFASAEADASESSSRGLLPANEPVGAPIRFVPFGGSQNATRAPADATWQKVDEVEELSAPLLAWYSSRAGALLVVDPFDGSEAEARMHSRESAARDTAFQLLGEPVAELLELF